MENRKSLIVSFAVILGIFGFPFFVFGYDAVTTHPALTKEIVNFHNLFFDGKISLMQAGFIMQGSIDEDEGVRYLNHFYDPVYNRGWKGQLSSKIWAKSSFAQSLSRKYLAGFFLTLDDSNDFSWERALQDYARGDERRAFLALGHTLHLLEDASVPEHTRDDTHIGHGQFGSPFETWAEKFTPQNFSLANALKTQGLGPLTKNSLGDYFDEVAKYSNSNFFSEDTIFTKEYKDPVIVDFKTEKLRGVDFLFAYGRDEDGNLVKLFSISDEEIQRNLTKQKFSINDPDRLTLNDYWSHLSRKAVLAGAGVVNLFLEEARIAREMYAKEVAQEKQKGFFEKLAGLFLSGSSITNDAKALSQGAEVMLSKMPQQNQKVLSGQNIDEDEVYEKSLRVQEFKGLSKGLSKENITNDDEADERYEAGLQHTAPLNSSQNNEQSNDPAHPQALPDNNKNVDLKKFPQDDTNTDQQKALPQQSSNASSAGSGVKALLASFARGDVRFWEIAWMGTASSANDEWIELFNTTAKEIPLEGWRIQRGDGTLLVGESGDEFKGTHKIAPGGYFLLERSEGATPVGADKLYDGSLSNAGETLLLQDGNGNEIDSITQAAAWQAGSNEVTSQGYKPTMSLVGNTWKDGVPMPKAFNVEYVKAKESIVPAPAPASFNSRAIIINEIAWMGTAQSSANEWLELFNNATSTINLSGWTLKSSDGSPAITLSGFVSPGGYVLLERTDDNSVPEVSADAIYTGALEDGGEVLTLRDPAGSEIDRVDAWYAGDKATKKTMQRASALIAGSESTNWFSAPGTPRAINKKEAPPPALPLAPPIISLLNYQITNLAFSVAWDLASSTPAFSSFEVQTHDGLDTSWKPFYSGTAKQAAFGATRETTYTFRARVLTTDGRTSDWAEIATEINPHPLVINEIMYHPGTGLDSYYEYVELYNRSSSFIDLSGWTLIVDGHGHALKNTLGTSLMLAPGGFALVGDKPGNSSDPNIYDGYYDVPGNSSSTLTLTIDSAALSLLNTSSRVRLQDTSGTIADDVSYYYLWGGNGNGRSLERVNPSQGGNTQENWKESAFIKGTPDRKNLAYDANARPGTLLPDSTFIDKDTLWTKAQSPYLLQLNGGFGPTVGALATLTIEPGVTIKSLSGCCTPLRVLGSVNAKGTPAEPIVITSSHATPGAGDWGNILFENNPRDSVLSWVTIEYGGHKFLGYGQDSAMLTLQNARVKMDNTTARASQGNGITIDGGDIQIQSSTIQDSSFDGIYVANGSPVIEHSTISHNRFGINILRGAPVVGSNTLNDNIQFPVYFFASAKAAFHENKATGNGSYNGIYVTVAGISENTTWTKDLPYILESSGNSVITVNASTTLTLEPGVIIKQLQKWDNNLIIFGALKAQGSASDPIIITSIHDDTAGGDTDSNGASVLPDAGDWRRILFKGGSSAILSNVSIRYGGYGNVGAISAEGGASVQTSSMNFQNNIKDFQGV